MTDPVLFLSGLAVIVILDLVTTATQAGYLNTNLARLLAQRGQTEPRVQRALDLVHSLRRLQASLGLALNILRFLFVGLGLLFLSQRTAVFSLPATSTRPAGLSLPALAGILLLAAVLLFWSEWLVEGWVLRSSDEWALRLTPYALFIMFLMTPFVLLPLRLAGDLQSLPEAVGTVTEDELKTLVDAGQEEGLLEQEERKMIYSIFEMGDTLAREIMVPRIDMIALDVNTPLGEAVDTLLKSGNSRVPVFEETVDNILGLLYAKDLLRAWRQGEQLNTLRALLRPAYFVPEAKKMDALLAEMQERHIHMAVVVDEYGGVAGLVTLEDIIEEILGEIQDEYDQGEESPYQQLAGGQYVFQGKVDLDDFNEILSSHLPKDEADTLGGFIYSRLGHVPSNGEQIRVDNLLLTVEQVTGRRIRKVRAEWAPWIDSKEREETHVDG